MPLLSLGSIPVVYIQWQLLSLYFTVTTIGINIVDTNGNEIGILGQCYVVNNTNSHAFLYIIISHQITNTQQLLNNYDINNHQSILELIVLLCFITLKYANHF